MVFPADSVLQRQAGSYAVGVLKEKRVVNRPSIVIALHVIDRSVVGDAQQEIGKGIAGESAGEIVKAVVVAGKEPERRDGADAADIQPKLQRVAAERPGCIVVPLVRVVLRSAI